MYCPQCGQQQVSEVTRYCSRCGFLLEGVSAVLASGGQIPMRSVAPSSRQQSPRSKGIRQGAMLMLSTLLLVPLAAIITVNLRIFPELIIPFTAIFCFVGGLLRILYAAIMEEPYPAAEVNHIAGYARAGMPQVDTSARNIGLPPASVNHVPGWRPRPNTAELYQP